ncbi:MAG: hypothetical protein GW761_12665 [Leptospira sp.]|jgi:hypothetical protein|nr:hypothetical protein [Leptospira sp.]
MPLTIGIQNILVHFIVFIVGFILLKPVILEVLKKISILKSPQKAGNSNQDTYLQSYSESCKECKIQH